MKFRALFSLAAALCLAAAAAHAAVPTQMTVQGKLTDVAGNPLPAGNKLLTFRIFDAPSGGNEIWPGGAGEVHFLSSDANGLWVAQVGSITALTDPVFADSLRWLQVTVNDGVNPITTMPRVRLVTGPFAYRVATVDGATGGTITSKVSIGPGHTNTGTDAFIAGFDNTASGDYSAIGGGTRNIASNDSATIGGGSTNTASGISSTVGGGSRNVASFNSATVAGGFENTASDNGASVGGGGFNLAGHQSTTVAGGYYNAATGFRATVGGGSEDTASGGSSTVSGGANNTASGHFSTIGGGTRNSAIDDSATIGGGSTNTASGVSSTVGGGSRNVASGDFSVIAGGGDNVWSNTATGNWSSIGGGLRNVASNNLATIAGGQFNLASGFVSTVAGNQNVASGHSSTVAGGFQDSATSFYSTVPGGYRNVAAGEGAFAAGFRAKARHDGAFVWADNTAADFASTTTKQFLIRASGGVGIGTNNPQARLHVSGAEEGLRIQGAGAGAANIAWIGLNDVNGAQTGFVGDINVSNDDIFLASTNGNVHLYTSAGATLTASASGDVNVIGNVCAANVACPSDERLKTDVHTLDNPIERVARLRGVGYRWKDDVQLARHYPDGEQVGLLAQEVQKVVPQAVHDMGDGYLAVDYSRLVPLLIEAVKEQQRTIEKQQRDIEEMQRAIQP